MILKLILLALAGFFAHFMTYPTYRRMGGSAGWIAGMGTACMMLLGGQALLLDDDGRQDAFIAGLMSGVFAFIGVGIGHIIDWCGDSDA